MKPRLRRIQSRALVVQVRDVQAIGIAITGRPVQ
eukprot:SAG31_NODE_18935_length_617_cov_1.256757_2_plen_33_part_01